MRKLKPEATLGDSFHLLGHRLDRWRALSAGDIEEAIRVTDEILGMPLTQEARRENHIIRERYEAQQGTETTLSALGRTVAQLDPEERAQVLRDFERDIHFTSRRLQIALLEAKGDPRVKGELRSLAEEILEDPCGPPREIEGSKNTVRVYNDRRTNEALVVKESEDQASFLAEFEAAEILIAIQKELKRWQPKFKVCTPILVREEDGKYIYVIEHSGCDTLAEAKGELVPFNYQDVARVTAALHHLFPREKLRGEERTLEDTLESRLHIKVKDLVLSNLDPLERAILETELSYNKDGHPWNYGITRHGDVIVFDTENNMPRRRAYDWANLTNHNRILTEEQKDAVFQEVVRTRKEFGELNKPEHKLAYYNAVCARTLELYGILRARKQIQHAKDMVLNSIEAVARIEIEFPMYFKDHRKQYTHLREGFQTLLTMIDSDCAS